jgi:hypothetical protein
MSDSPNTSNVSGATGAENDLTNWNIPQHVGLFLAAFRLF